MQLFLISQLALADAAPAMDICNVSEPVGSHPAASAVNVPLDVVPAVFFSEGGCGGDEWSLTLSNDAGVVAEAVVQVTRRIGELEPSAPLEPETLYTLTMVATDGSSEESTVAFTTGTEATRTVGITPELLELVPTTVQDSFVVQADAIAGFGSIPGEDLAVRWQDGPGTDLTLVAYGMAAAGTETSRAWETGTSEAEPPEWCAAVSVREFNGDWAASEARCEPVEVLTNSTPGATECACNGTGAGAGGAAAAVAALLAAARRRR